MDSTEKVEEFYGREIEIRREFYTFLQRMLKLHTLFAKGDIVLVIRESHK